MDLQITQIVYIMLLQLQMMAYQEIVVRYGFPQQYLITERKIGCSCI